MSADPWFTEWNHHLFQILFRFLPYSRFTDHLCDLLITNPLLSTWVYAACFYRYWTKDDDHQPWRRRYLVEAVVAFTIAVFATLILRPWIYWPAPVLNPHFQPLFPRFLWGNGSTNCFPSHSTLAYVMMAAGLWPLNRRLAVCLSGMALLLISLPRVYQGGHYPIDVLFSCVLGVVTIAAVWRGPVPAGVSKWFGQLKFDGLAWDLLFFVWAFELGEGFRGLELFAATVHHAFARR